jgi:hypothetical protein
MTVVGLPPQMCDVNLTELAGAEMKRIVRENSVTGGRSEPAEAVAL